LIKLEKLAREGIAIARTTKILLEKTFDFNIMKIVLSVFKLTLLFLGLSDIVADAADAYCPVEKLLSCNNHLEKCTPKIWHGIDSLEVFELSYLNETSIKIKSLNNTFKDTVASVVIQPKNNVNDNPLHCVNAPPLPTGEGNCTTKLVAYFSDAGKLLTSTNLQSCGIISWMNDFGTYGNWVHADEPTPAPASDICKFSKDTEVYHEVGTYGKDAMYFTMQTVNATSVKIKSLNNSFPDVVSSIKIVHGAQEKLAFTANLFNGVLFHGIMRSNEAGTPNCCKSEKSSNGTIVGYYNCPLINWWSATGERSCWETTRNAHDNEGECGE
jgi:hypothetical protein